MTATDSITIRRAPDRDAAALARLAILDSSSVPEGDLLLAEEGTELRAAISLPGGNVIADPFHRTLPLVELLRVRADRMATPLQMHRGGRLRHAWAHSR